MIIKYVSFCLSSFLLYKKREFLPFNVLKLTKYKYNFTKKYIFFTFFIFFIICRITILLSIHKVTFIPTQFQIIHNIFPAALKEKELKKSNLYNPMNKANDSSNF